MIKRVVMINNSHFIVEFPEKTDSTQYIKREIIDEAAGLDVHAPHRSAHC